MTEISVIGAGFVGVAHTAFLSKYYSKINLIDKNVDLIKKLSLGSLPFASSDGRLNKIFCEGVLERKINPSSNIEFISNSSIVFISIGFDFTNDDNGFDNLKKLIQKIVTCVNDDCLIVLETTVPPGTSEKVVLPILLRESENKKINYVYSYERVMPGPNYLKSVEELPKVYAGLNDTSVKKYESHLGLVCRDTQHTRLNKLVSAETSKVFENTYRMMNIAIVQEFAEFAAHIGANVPDILDCIRERPTHSNIRYTGLAPGGYCLTKDPNFLISSAELNGFNYDFPILNATNKIVGRQNNSVLRFVTEKMNFQSSYHFLGISYLPGVGDLRGSSSLLTFEKLLELGYDVSVVDPYCKGFLGNATASSAIKGDVDTPGNAILATRHPEFTLEEFEKFQVLIDINTCLSKSEKLHLRSLGVSVYQYGESQ